jgi:NAD(P)-dependent dehydrogenase (short-subunit alcohol dehydrogenase family)
LQKGNVIITGGTSGLGYELVKCFISEGYGVFATGRDQTKLIDLGERVQFVKVNFSDLSDVKRNMQGLLDKRIRFDIIINNCGVLSSPEFILTDNDIEYSFQVNFLSHLLINELIIREKSDNDPITIVSVTSPVYKFIKPDFKAPDRDDYRSFKVYGESKFYLLLIGEYLSEKYKCGSLKFFGFNPGIFSSGIYRIQHNWFQKMYRFAAPFMQNPSKSARILTEILKDHNVINGAVYNRNGKFRIPDKLDKETMNHFMTKSSDKIKPFIE